MKTRILKVPLGSSEPGHFLSSSSSSTTSIDTWQISTSPSAHATLTPLREAAHLLRSSDIPVAFPTETVYGLGADATRSAAVRGIYAAKGRPSDNPLIVHVCDLDMLRGFLDAEEGIPEIYRELVKRFWPGPLTILLRCPRDDDDDAACSSHDDDAAAAAGAHHSTHSAHHHHRRRRLLAPEVTAGLPTFGARMPASPLARTLIQLAGVPLAAPSANASTKPSPTAASHVLDDLDGRIELILDGGNCDVGVESTVVDGLCEDGGPPLVLRPGGVSMEELRSVPGWEGVVKGYRDESEEGKKGALGPRAPGMKYKHYSPRAKVVLFEAKSGKGIEDVRAEMSLLAKKEETKGVIGIIRTLGWQRLAGDEELASEQAIVEEAETNGHQSDDLGYEISTLVIGGARVLDIGLGQQTKMVAQGLFSALRELDRKGADVVFVEGIEDREDIAAAVMNRLRKAASEIRV